jgi:CheY-like chemotaxis protein
MGPAQEPSRRPLRVLIIDCHAAFRIAAKALLETEGLQVLDDVELEDAPDVVLIDVGPGRLDGLELARHFAARPHPPAIVLMSAVTADELLTSAVGADAFLAKAAVTAEGLTRAAAIAGAR